ncbi:MAG: hypothetical protein ACRYFV_21235 [Janthinobacterium lividum]
MEKFTEMPPTETNYAGFCDNATDATRIHRPPQTSADTTQDASY